MLPIKLKFNSSSDGLESRGLKSSAPVQSISYSLSNWSWPSFPSPDIQWPSSFTFVDVQERFSALLLELGLGPASLYDEIVNKPPDLNIHPECEWDAEVRIGEELCMAERAFLGERRRRMKASFARLMNVPESEVDERDLPVVAIAGSGGGEHRVSSCSQPSSLTIRLLGRIPSNA